MNKSPVLTLILLTCGAIAPAGAAIVTVDPVLQPSGTDISNAYPGLIMQVVTGTPGSTTYIPVTAPVLAETCISYGPCPGFGPLASIGGIASLGDDYEHCYDNTQVGWTTHDCHSSWNVLELNFAQGTDFIEVSSMWNIDPPAIIAYDAAGNEILFCKAVGPGNPNVGPGSPAGCIIWQQFAPGQEFIGTLRLQTASPVIARVVFASMAGSAIATGIQYSWSKKPPCKCRALLD